MKTEREPNYVIYFTYRPAFDRPSRPAVGVVDLVSLGHIPEFWNPHLKPSDSIWLIP